MRAIIKVQNLKCSGCASKVQTELYKINGLRNVEVNLELNEVSFDTKDTANEKNVALSLSKMGYPLQGENNTIGTKLKSYISCANGKLTKI